MAASPNSPPAMNPGYYALILVSVCGLLGCKPKPPITKVEALQAARNYIIQQHLPISPYDRAPTLEFYKYRAGHPGPVWKVDFTRPVKNAPRTPDGDLPLFGPIIWVRASGTVETNEWHSP